MPDAEPLDIDPLSLKSRLDSEPHFALLDVREPWEAEIGAIEGATLIPLAELSGRLAEVPSDRPLAILCHHGGRSAQATAWLRAQGFQRAMNVTGGIDAWSRLVDPGVARY